MRLVNAPAMTRDAFDALLAEAEAGWVVTDSGASDELAELLRQIAEAAPNVPPALITAAREAFAAQ